MRRLAGCGALVAATLMVVVPAAAMRATAAGSGPPSFCQHFATQASAGAQLYCLGARSATLGTAGSTSGARHSSNVDAANFVEDRTPTGVQARGQSEVSVAANLHYVVEAWNDSTGFYASCGDPGSREELTGFGFSSDSGASFVDLGGLPNAACHTTRYFGDASVETWTSGGSAYFYVSSLYVDSAGNNAIAMSACHAAGAGSAAKLTCGQPIEMAALFGRFLDKDFLAIDRQRGRLYVSYTDFPFDGSTRGQIELASCDIGDSAGHAGPLGGTAGAPVCPQPAAGLPQFVVSPGDPNCVQSGSYPSVDPASGTVYVAWEFNWTSSFGNCSYLPVREEVAATPAHCVTPTPSPSGCTGPAVTSGVPVISLANENVPGYLVNAVNDFPRIAVSERYGTVTMVYNGGDQHPNGDILMQSFKLNGLQRVQPSPLRLNSDVSTPFKLLPALRAASSDGSLPVSWYDRRLGSGSALTDVYMASVSPLATRTPTNKRVTDVSSDWLNTTSDVVPNFGDYTDNNVDVSSGNTTFVAWSDGRIGEPQPYVSRRST